MTYTYPHSYPEVFVREGTEETVVAKSPADPMQKEIMLCGDDRMDKDTASTTAIPSMIFATATGFESATETAAGTNSLTTPRMHSALRPSLERRDSNRPPTPPGMANDSCHQLHETFEHSTSSVPSPTRIDICSPFSSSHKWTTSGTG